MEPVESVLCLTVLNRGRAGIISKCEHLLQCVFQKRPFLPDVGAILSYSEKLWQPRMVVEHTVLLFEEMQHSVFPPSDMSDICYCLLLLRSLSCSFLKLLCDIFFLAACCLFTIKKPRGKYLGTNIL